MAPTGPKQVNIMKPPDQITRAAPSSHPRRPPAHRSVSLLHASRAKLSPLQDRSDSSSDSNLITQQRAKGGNSNDSQSSLLPLGRDSSGESSNAEKWFDKSNNDVRDNSASFADNDPPFFMRNSSSSDTPPEALRQARQYNLGPDGSSSLPLRTGLLQLGTDGSSTEDFRSVIDDLTIQNKKLKRRLKKYEKLHDSHLRDEKLFEVRVHGLPPEKKRELEETLRKFTASLGTNGFHPNGYEGLLPVLNSHHKGGSSQTSLQNDSAYASMSASGQGSSGHSGNDTMYRPRFPTAAARRQNIHSYLHHIPEALLVHPNPATMSERQKKKLAVRRLEQIFAGTRAAAGIHQHPMQQQEISQMAAQESRSAGEALGQRARQEGLREAHIMIGETEEPADPTVKREQNDTSPDDDSHSFINQPGKLTHQASGSHTDHHVEQRPTRPMDIDPHRAQVPSENMRYIRHLGFSPPDIEHGRALEEGHGWIYLNLLINMAQLHTINVTADFVRKALSDHQSNLELSHDGRKVRWKGGPPLTRSSSSGGGSSNDYVGMDTPDGQSPRKRPRLTARDSGLRPTPGLPRGATASSRGHESNKMVYTPLFFHKSSTESDDSSSEEDEDESMTSPYPIALAGDSSGMTSSGMRTISAKKNKRRDDGPIIFYNNARFCTDLSGDRKPMGNVNAALYTNIGSQPIGKPPVRQTGNVFETRGPLARASELPEPMDLGDNPIPESMELSFPPQPYQNSADLSPKTSFAMEVSGIGGVWPADHFAINVESRRTLVNDEDETDLEPASSVLIPPRFREILRGDTAKHKAHVALHEQEIVSLKKKDLPPSELPPAVGFIGLDESNADDSDDEEMSMSPGSPVAFPPSAAPQPVELHYASSDEDEEEEEDDDEDDGESSGSLDLLATAREADPEAIRQREREYDANMAERLADDIPAGSSAATAGGGSGFASPASGMNREAYQRALKEARGRGEAFTRAKTSDSMVVQGADDSSDEEDDENEEMSDVAS